MGDDCKIYGGRSGFSRIYNTKKKKFKVGGCPPSPRHRSAPGLVVYGTKGAKVVKAFRNIPGVEISNIERLNLLKLAPGGHHLRRFIKHTKSAFEKLDSIYRSLDKASAKEGYMFT